VTWLQWILWALIVVPVVLILLAGMFGGEHLHSDGTWRRGW